jgi:hypothetical protein
MQQSNLKVTLKANQTLVVAGERVTLKATVFLGGKPVDDLNRYEIDFDASDGDVKDKSQATAVWHTRDMNPGRYKIVVTVTDKETETEVEDEVSISVLSDEPSITVTLDPSAPVPEGTVIKATAHPSEKDNLLSELHMSVKWDTKKRGDVSPESAPGVQADWDTTDMVSGSYVITARLVYDDEDRTLADGIATATVERRPIAHGDVLPVTLRRTTANSTADKVLWSLIRERTGALSFMGGGYKQFIDRVLCDPDDPELVVDPHVRHRLSHRVKELGTHSYGMAAYDLLKTATEVYLLIECGVAIDKSFDREGFDPDMETGRLGESVTAGELKNRLNRYFASGRLPYLDRVVSAVFPDGNSKSHSIFCPGALSSRVTSPCMLELIWSYWHEEGMLVQSMNAISRRFQNVRGPGDRDPLAHLEIDPLRPLNNLLWGYIQDEQNLLTVKRRAYEYDHQYGLRIHGKAVPPLRPADSRSKFLEGFHNLLHVTSVFYKEDNDTTVIADGFPLLNALREVHLVLAQGAHNQFGDLPWTARSEMLIQQWLLAQPQMREFMQSRPMVPYKEPWMAQVDTMKTLQGWSDVTVTHFRDLGTYGEQILLTIRYGDWIDVNDEDSAKNWARYWRPEIQSYIHAYRTVTGIDLTNPDTVDYTMPTVHLQKRLAMQRTR